MVIYMTRKLTNLMKIGFVVLPLTVLVLAGTTGCTKGSAEGNDKNDLPDQTENSLELQTEGSKTYYEITPSDPEWKDMDLSEAYDKTSLKKLDYDVMSTEEVLDVCLDYPYLMEILAFNSFQQAISTFKGRAKQFDVLYNREDSPKVILDAIRSYKQTATDGAEELKNFNGETFMFAMLRCLYLDGRLTKEEFKEAEKLHFTHMNEHNAFYGGETIPYDPDVPVVYFDDGDKSVQLDENLTPAGDAEESQIVLRELESEWLQNQ